MATSATIIQSSVEGRSTLPNSAGPLAPLFTNPNSSQILKYPSNLGDSRHQHMIMFTALVNTPSGYDETTDFSIKIPDTSSSGGWGGVESVDEQTNLTFQPKRTRSSDVVALYMPDTISFGYAVSYSTTSLKDAMQEIAEGVGKMADAATGKKIGSGIVKGINSVVDSKAVKLGMNMAGLAVNPQNQLLFDNIDFRQYQLSFTFTPKTKQESTDVYNIIKLFRFHAAPRINTGVGAMMFDVPDSFLVQFISPNASNQATGSNQFVTRVKESVLTNVDVNYAPNGIWSTHWDGSPTQITMNLTFKEIVLVDKTAIENGF
jgi:hypothetical protein